MQQGSPPPAALPLLVSWVGIGLLGLPPTAAAGPRPTQDGWDAVRWSPLELTFQGPEIDEASTDPNPFLDHRLQVVFQAPSGATFDVPGFYDGDGSGSGSGPMWKVRFTPDEAGEWSWTASFRSGENVAVQPEPEAGVPAAFDGEAGRMTVGPVPDDAEGFHRRGRLGYAGGPYLRFQDGGYFLKTGTNSPENLLGFEGFDAVEDQGGLSTGIVHAYGPHLDDWQPGDPELGASSSPDGLRGLVGALNYLSDVGVNAVYFLPMNLGGDGQETAPFLGYGKTTYDKTHYDVSRLEQWNTVFEHAMRCGIQLQFVLAETEPENETWLDGGALGVERKLFYRELVARFAHHPAIKWNLSEENDFGVDLLRDMAAHLKALDPYDHPIGVHTHADTFDDYEALLGEPDFTITSIQYANDLAGTHVETWRERSAKAGHPWVIDMDENGDPIFGVSADNADEFRREVLYDVLFSGGNVEWYLGSVGLPVGGDHSLEDFRSREAIYAYSRIAREILETHFEFWTMTPADDRVNGESTAYGGAEVFAAPNGDLAVYLPEATPSARVDLSDYDAQARFFLRWIDPRDGTLVGPGSLVPGGGDAPLVPPANPEGDWVVLVERLLLHPAGITASVSTDPTLSMFLDAGPAHAFEQYQLLVSISGMDPGTQILGVELPLNWDLVTALSLAEPGLFGNGLGGTLDAAGRATVELDMASLAGSAAVGLPFFYAYLGGPGVPQWASNAVSVLIQP